jgi:hypothetical protein
LKKVFARHFRWALLIAFGGVIALFQNCGGAILRSGADSNSTKLFDSVSLTKIVGFGEVHSLKTVAEDGSTIELTVNTRQTAGAINSIKWREQEILDAYDKGRHLQSTISLGGHGECFNPTEAGAFQDDPKGSSSSKVLAITGSEKQISSTTQMAYWLSDRDSSETCPTGQVENKDRILSEHFIERNIVKAPNGDEHVFLLDTTFKVSTELPAMQTGLPEAIFEAATAYLPYQFSQIYTLDLMNGKIIEEPKRVRGEQDRPIIIATADGESALGVFSPQLPQSGLGYGRFDFSDIADAPATKWSCGFRIMKNFKPGDYQFHCYIAVGTLEQVKRSILNLARSFNKALPAQKIAEIPQLKGQIDGIFEKGDGKVIAGWTCAEGQSKPISLKLFAGSTAEKAKEIAAVTTVLPAEIAVNSRCGLNGDSTAPVRFEVPIYADLIKKYSGKYIYAKAFHPLVESGSDLILDQSGLFTIPAAKEPEKTVTKVTKAKIVKPYMGSIDGIFKEGNTHFLHGWACNTSSKKAEIVNIRIGNYMASDVTTANLAAESELWTNCPNSDGFFRFKWEVHSSVIEGLGGQSVYGFIGKGFELSNSGKIKIPKNTKVKNKVAETSKKQKPKKTVGTPSVEESIETTQSIDPNVEINLRRSFSMPSIEKKKELPADSASRSPANSGGTNPDFKVKLKPAKKQKKR